jgi:hypothetical protein
LCYPVPPPPFIVIEGCLWGDSQEVDFLYLPQLLVTSVIRSSYLAGRIERSTRAHIIATITHTTISTHILFFPYSIELIMSGGGGGSGAMKSGGSGGGGSAWSRPLNNRGRFSNNNDSSSNNNSGGGGGQQRPPPGMEGGGGGGGGSSRFGGWGNRGGGGNSTNGYAKKSNNNNNSHGSALSSSPNTANATTNNNNAALSNSQQQQQQNQHEIILRERFLHLTLSMVGHTVTLTTTEHQIIEGVFHTFTPFDSLNDTDMKNQYVIKACRTISSSQQQQQQQGDATTTTTNGDNKSSLLVEEGGTLVLSSDRVISVQVKSMRLDNTNIIMNNGLSSSAASLEKMAIPGEGGGDTSSTFQTDSQISGGRGGNHALVAAGSVWTSAGDGSSTSSVANDASLGSSSAAPYRFNTPSGGGVGGKKGADSLNWRAAAARGGGGVSSLSSNNNSMKPSSAPSTGMGGALDGSIGDWDQFSANERKFNVKASFDENLYTTKLDVSNIDMAKIAEAERIAREIEGTASSNIHIAEERNQAIQTDFDEEDLYSGVLTKDLKARTIAVVPDAPSTTTTIAATTTATTTTTGHVEKEEEKKKGVASVGKVMNYAQAAAKKGLAEKVVPKPPTPVAGSTTATAAAATSASASKNAEVATPSDGKASTTTPLPTSAEKIVEPEAAGEKPGAANTDVKSHDNDNRKKDGETTKDDKAETTAAAATTTATATSKPKLNPNAKAFTFNPTAKSFTPSFAAPPAASVSPMPPMQQQPPPPHGMDSQMMMPPHPHAHGEYHGAPHMMGMGMGGPQFAPMHGEFH